MRPMLAVLLIANAAVCQSQVALSQHPIAKGAWTYEDGMPESVTFEYGTELSAEDIDRISGCTSLTRIEMGYAGIDSEYVTVEGGLLKLRQLKNLREVHLCKDGINDDDLRFIASLPNLRSLEFNADNGHDGAPICTDRCAEYVAAARTLRRLVIHDGRFTDAFVASITNDLTDLEELWLNSPGLTDESLRLIADRCKKLKSLSIASDHFSVEGVKVLDQLPSLDQRSVSSPALRKQHDESDKFVGTWESLSATHEGKPIDAWQDATVTITHNSWSIRWNGTTMRSTWEIDSTRNPKWLTRVTRGGTVNFLENAIYKFDGEKLVICETAFIDGRRPAQFRADAGDAQYLIVLRRKDKSETSN